MADGGQNIRTERQHDSSYSRLEDQICRGRKIPNGSGFRQADRHAGQTAPKAVSPGPTPMAIAELSVLFHSSLQVTVAFGDADSGRLEFSVPFSPQDREDIRWYVETYGVK